MNRQVEHERRANGTPDQAALDPDAQATAVNKHFASAANHWDRLYQEATLDGRIYQDRMAIALQLIDQLHLPHTARLLEIGCGAGYATVALARRGYRIDALDSVPTMIEIACKRIAESGTADKVRLGRADVRRLPMPDGSFDLVLALGVIPWLDDPAAAVREMARVLRPGGYLLLSIDHDPHLEEVLDPRRNPVLKPLRRLVAAVLRAAGLLAPARSETHAELFHRHSRRNFEAILSGAGLHKVRGLMVGFGPFTFFGRKLFSDSTGIKVHRALQAAAIRQLPIVSSYGFQYLVMATRPEESPLVSSRDTSDPDKFPRRAPGSSTAEARYLSTS